MSPVEFKLDTAHQGAAKAAGMLSGMLARRKLSVNDLEACRQYLTEATFAVRQLQKEFDK